MHVNAQDKALIDILSDELDREFSVLSKADDPVYYMDYQVLETKQQTIQCNMGSLYSSNVTHSRLANTNLRIGDYQLDNTHGTDQFSYEGFASMPISLDNEEKSISHALWTMTNFKYQGAVEQYHRIKKESESKNADFSKQDPEIYLDELSDVDMEGDKLAIENLLKNLSAMFLQNKDILDGEISLNRQLITKYFVSSEGSKVVHQLSHNFLSIQAKILDDEGELIPLFKTYFAFDVSELLDEAALRDDITKLIQTLVELKDAPLAEPYSGPAILHPLAAGVFFHEIFGHRIEGSRLSSEYDSQTFKEKVGELVLPKTMNVYMDPTLKELRGKPLIGHYSFDDEGVRAQRVKVVEKGILKNFLMTRKPLDEFTSSNGHARTQGGLPPVSRQSNLVVESSKQLSEENLRKQLIKECKKQNKAYGYYFVDVTGGLTSTNRYTPNAFNIFPTVVYRVYVDGRPDELVRGVDLIGTPLSMFAEIKLASENQDTFNGYCGAESGMVPVSATSPGLLVRRIETQKKMRQINKEEAPILPRPLKSQNDN